MYSSNTDLIKSLQERIKEFDERLKNLPLDNTYHQFGSKEKDAYIRCAKSYSIIIANLAKAIEKLSCN